MIAPERKRCLVRLPRSRRAGLGCGVLRIEAQRLAERGFVGVACEACAFGVGPRRGGLELSGAVSLGERGRLPVEPAA